MNGMSAQCFGLGRRMTCLATAFAAVLGCAAPTSEPKTERKESMQFYYVRSKDLVGRVDYIFIHGMIDSKRRNGSLVLHRTGPFVPAFTEPSMDDFVVTDAARESAIDHGVCSGADAFIPVILEKIVEFHWERWYLAEEAPPEARYPMSPEEFINHMPHSDRASEQMGPLWEWRIPVGSAITVDRERRRKPGFLGVLLNTWSGAHVFFGEEVNGPARYLIVDAAGKEWLEDLAGEWLTFIECRTET